MGRDKKKRGGESVSPLEEAKKEEVEALQDKSERAHRSVESASECLAR